jgi:hypothetical protein
MLFSRLGRGLVRAAACSIVALAVCASGAYASLDVFYSDVGNIRLSVDAIGSNGVSGTIQVAKPAGATVKRAFMFAASTGFTSFTPPDDEVSIDGTAVTWDPVHTMSNGISSTNVAADVTGIVKDKLDISDAGRVDFAIAEKDTGYMDGEILAVEFSDAAAPQSTVALMYGAQSTTGDHFALGLASPLKPSNTLTMGLGISFGYQPIGQFSQVDVNGTRISTSAGGQDDGVGVNGALITAGGLDDLPDNPADPLATDETCGNAPRCDDELYDLKPFVASDAASIGIDTLNPSRDDNIFFAAFTLAGVTAGVGQGVVLSPAGTRQQASNFHFVKARVQDDAGHPVAGRSVHLGVVDGPNQGASWTATTGSDGKASFNYASSALGTDTLQASYVDNGTTYVSNPATQTWIRPVTGTFGGAWPYNGSNLDIYYSYGGGHRYLGNATQGASNWNAAGTKVHVAQWPGVPAAVHVPMIDDYLPDTWWGMTIFADDGQDAGIPGCIVCSYTRNSIIFNQRTLDSASDAQRTKVATHELGHALGLEHPYGWADSSAPSVMWQGEVGGRVKTTPQALDTDRVNRVYP